MFQRDDIKGWAKGKSCEKGGERHVKSMKEEGWYWEFVGHCMEFCFVCLFVCFF